jgi:hypothetical protein
MKKAVAEAFLQASKTWRAARAVRIAALLPAGSRSNKNYLIVVPQPFASYTFLIDLGLLLRM